MRRSLEDLSAIWLATIIEGVTVLMGLAALFVWAGIATGRL